VGVKRLHALGVPLVLPSATSKGQGRSFLGRQGNDDPSSFQNIRLIVLGYKGTIKNPALEGGQFSPHIWSDKRH
jgi:hypothetical protein